MSSISLFDIISVVLLPDPKILYIPASAAYVVAIKGIKTLLANGLITFFINGIQFLVMDQVIYQEILQTVSFLITEFLMT